LVIAAGVGVVEPNPSDAGCVSIGVVVSASGSESDCWISRGRARAGTCAYWLERSSSPDHGWVSTLEDAGSADTPAACDPAHKTMTATQSAKLIVQSQGEAVGHVPRRQSVILLWVCFAGVCRCVVLRSGSRIGRVKGPAVRETAFQFEKYTFIVAITIVVGIGNCTEARVQPFGRQAVIQDEVPRERIDVLA